jgi:hypothetical protein
VFKASSIAVYHRSDWGSERRGYGAIELAVCRKRSSTTYRALELSNYPS